MFSDIKVTLQLLQENWWLNQERMSWTQSIPLFPVSHQWKWCLHAFPCCRYGLERAPLHHLS